MTRVYAVAGTPAASACTASVVRHWPPIAQSPLLTWQTIRSPACLWRQSTASGSSAASERLAWWCSAPERALLGAARNWRRLAALRTSQRATGQAGDDRVGDARRQREIRVAPGPGASVRAASRLIAHSARRAAAPTLTIRPPCRSPPRAAWRSALHGAALGCSSAANASATDAELAGPRDPPAGLAARLIRASDGDAPGTRRGRAHVATVAHRRRPPPSRQPRRRRSVALRPSRGARAGRAWPRNARGDDVRRARRTAGVGGALALAGISLVARPAPRPRSGRPSRSQLLCGRPDRRRRGRHRRPIVRVLALARLPALLLALDPRVCRRSRTSSRRSESNFCIEPIRASSSMSSASPSRRARGFVDRARVTPREPLRLHLLAHSGRSRTRARPMPHPAVEREEPRARRSDG